MGFIPLGDDVMLKSWKRQEQLDRMPASVREKMTPEQIRDYLFQDIPRSAPFDSSDAGAADLEEMERKIRAHEDRNRGTSS